MADKQLWVKICHWANAILCIVLIITGLHMQYSGSEYTFIPFNVSIVLHNICGALLILSYIGFIIGNIKSRNIKNYKIRMVELTKDIWVQIHYYAFGIFKREKEPFPVDANREFNPLQKFTYVLVMFICIPIMIITGLAMGFPELIAGHTFGNVGFFLTDILHVTVGFIISIFLMIHIYFAYFHGFSKEN